MKSDPLVELASMFLIVLFISVIVITVPATPPVNSLNNECRQAKETLARNNRELVLIAQNSNQDILSFLEKNRWITDSLEQEKKNACEPAN